MAESLTRGRAKDWVRLAVAFIVGGGLSLLLFLVVGAPKQEGLPKGEKGDSGTTDGMGLISEFAAQFRDRREQLESEKQDLQRVQRLLGVDQTRLRSWSREIPEPANVIAALESARTPAPGNVPGAGDAPAPGLRRETLQELRTWFDTHFGILWLPGVEKRDELRWQYDVDGRAVARLSDAYRRGIPPLVRELHRDCLGTSWEEGDDWLRPEGPMPTQAVDSPRLDACTALVKLDESTFLEWRSAVERELAALDDDLASQSASIDADLQELQKRSDMIYGAFYKESSLEALVRWSLPILAVVIMFVVLVGSAESEGSRDGSGLRTMMRLLTVVLLIASILILGLSDKLSSEVLGALIGGISGYVLGRQNDVKRTGDSSDGRAPLPPVSDDSSGAPEPAAPAASTSDDEAPTSHPPAPQPA